MTSGTGDRVSGDPLGDCGLDMESLFRETCRCRTHGDVEHEWRGDDGWECVLCDGQRWSG